MSKDWCLGSDLHSAGGGRGYPGPASSGAPIAEKWEVSGTPGPLTLLLRRLQRIGTHLASTQPRDRLGLEAAGEEANTGVRVDRRKGVAFNETGQRGPGSSGSARRLGGDDVEQDGGTREPLSRGCAVEAEEEIISLLCILSALVRKVVLAIPESRG